MGGYTYGSGLTSPVQLYVCGLQAYSLAAPSEECHYEDKTLISRHTYQLRFIGVKLKTKIAEKSP
jgi:hypothetical protein